MGLVVTGAVQPYSYIYGTLTQPGTTRTNQRVWCVDYAQFITPGENYSQSPAYTYEQVLASPSLATGIEQTGRLNQAAFLLNAIDIGISVATGPQVLWNKTYTGCAVISASDFQSVLWALLQRPGECDRSTGGGLCLDTLSAVNECNVAYLWNLAFANVPNNTRYYVPTSSCQHTVVYPLVIVPEPPSDQSTQVQIVAVDINSWGASPACICEGSSFEASSSETFGPFTMPTELSTTIALVSASSKSAAGPLTTSSSGVTDCVTIFKDEFPIFSPNFQISGGPQPNALVYGTIEVNQVVHTDQNIWCVDLRQDVIIGFDYTASPVFTWEDVIANPGLALHIEQPQRLNQVAWLLNNVVVGVTVASGPNNLQGNSYDGCSVISSSDVQATIWELVQAPGTCNFTIGGGACAGYIHQPNVCNVAYMIGAALSAVRDGERYQVPTSKCNSPVIYPLVIIPEPPPDQQTQVLIVAVQVSSWISEGSCACNSTNPSTPSHVTSTTLFVEETSSSAVETESSTRALSTPLLETTSALEAQSTTGVYSSTPTPVNCVAAFEEEFPTVSDNFQISTAPQDFATSYGLMDVGTFLHTGIKVWCIDFRHTVYNGNKYASTPVYTLGEVLSDSNLAKNIQRPDGLNQVAWLLNNIVVGKTQATGPQTTGFNTYDGCSVISSSDFQSAIWAFVQEAGTCDLQGSDYLCTLTDFEAPNLCNVAYLYNTALDAVKEGHIYNISDNNCNGPVIYPLIVVPENPGESVAQPNQVLIAAVDIDMWGGPSCSCDTPQRRDINLGVKSSIVAKLSRSSQRAKTLPQVFT